VSINLYNESIEKFIGGSIVMKIKQIRNATMVLDYNGVRFLIDPMLGEKGSYPPFPSLRGDESNPLIDLPESIESITDSIDAVIVTHTHIDHWDPKAIEVLDKNLTIIVQNEYDADVIKKDGFENVQILENRKEVNGVFLNKTPGKHFTDEETKVMMDKYTSVTDTMGIIFSSKNEKTIYLSGDTIWYEEVENVLNTYQPEIIILNAGGNQFEMNDEDSEKGRLLMNEHDMYEVYKASPQSTIIASHMEAVNHWYTSKDDLKQMAEKHDFLDQLFVPNDGEAYTF